MPINRLESLANGMRQMFLPFEEVARDRHVCPCCERAFTPDEEDEFVKKVGDEIIKDCSFCLKVKCCTCSLCCFLLSISAKDA